MPEAHGKSWNLPNCEWRAVNQQFCSDLASALAINMRNNSPVKMRENHMSKKAAEHHKQASEHLTHAARHHGEAAKHHEAGSHEKAAHHAHVARGHVIHSRDTLKRR